MTNELFQYFIVVIFFTMIGIFLYIKIRYPFWNGQPVFHTYDYYRKWLCRKPFIVNEGYPSITKYCDFDHIVTMNDLTEDHVSCFVDLVQCHYLDSEADVVYLFNKDIYRTLFAGHIHPSYISFYIVPFLGRPKTIGTISSRSVQILVQGHAVVPGYYWDFICVHRSHKSQKISRNLIQTHEYRARIQTPSVVVSLFKKEGELSDGIVPFVQYKSYTRIVDRGFERPRLPRYFMCNRVGQTNLATFMEFIESHKSRFKASILTDLGNLGEMILGNVLYVYCVESRGTIYGIYIFRDLRIVSGDMAHMSLIGSIHGSNSAKLFCRGYLNALWELKESVAEFGVISLDDLSDNGILLRDVYDIPSRDVMEDSLKEDVSIESAYYFYNYVCDTVAGKDVLIVL